MLLGVDTELQLEQIPRWRSGSGGSALLLAILWAAFLAACRWALDPRPVLRLDARGLELRLFGRLAWSRVESWTLRPEPRGAALEIRFAEGVRPARRAGLWLALRWLLPPFGARRLVLRSARTEEPLEDLVAVLRARLPKREIAPGEAAR